MRRHIPPMPPRQQRSLLRDYWRRFRPGCAETALLDGFDGKVVALMWDLGRAH